MIVSTIECKCDSVPSGWLAATLQPSGPKHKTAVLYSLRGLNRLCGHSPLTQRQAGEFLNLSTGAAASIQLKNLASAASSKRKIRKQLSELEAVISRGIDLKVTEQV